MVLEIAGGLFGQNDVRETASGSAEQSNYNTSDFEVIADIVNLKSKTSYLSISPGAFSTWYPDTDAVQITQVRANAETNGIYFHAAISLPHGAVVTSCIMYGNAGATAETWDLRRCSVGGVSSSSLASAAIGTADTSISNATIDNETYKYAISTSSIDTGDEIYGARITYTTDYD